MLKMEIPEENEHIDPPTYYLQILPRYAKISFCCSFSSSRKMLGLTPLVILLVGVSLNITGSYISRKIVFPFDAVMKLLKAGGG